MLFFGVLYFHQRSEPLSALYPATNVLSVKTTCDFVETIRCGWVLAPPGTNSISLTLMLQSRCESATSQYDDIMINNNIISMMHAAPSPPDYLQKYGMGNLLRQVDDSWSLLGGKTLRHSVQVRDSLNLVGKEEMLLLALQRRQRFHFMPCHQSTIQQHP